MVQKRSALDLWRKTKRHMHDSNHAADTGQQEVCSETCKQQDKVCVLKHVIKWKYLNSHLSVLCPLLKNPLWQQEVSQNLIPCTLYTISKIESNVVDGGQNPQSFFFAKKYNTVFPQMIWSFSCQTNRDRQIKWVSSEVTAFIVQNSVLLSSCYSTTGKHANIKRDFWGVTFEILILNQSP